MKKIETTVNAHKVEVLSRWLDKPSSGSTFSAHSHLTVIKPTASPSEVKLSRCLPSFCNSCNKVCWSQRPEIQLPKTGEASCLLVWRGFIFISLKAGDKSFCHSSNSRLQLLHINLLRRNLHQPFAHIHTTAPLPPSESIGSGWG